MFMFMCACDQLQLLISAHNRERELGVQQQFTCRPEQENSSESSVFIFFHVFFLSLVTGRLLDATKNYMFVFLLAGSEVFLSALVLASCNYLCIRKKSTSEPDKLESITVSEGTKMEVCSDPEGVDDKEEKESKEEQKKEIKTEVIKEEKAEEAKPESVGAQKVETFLTQPQQDGDMASSPETCL